MASFGSFKQKFDDQLTCSVCLDQYIKPKTLPCHHSFCLECIQRIPAERKGGQYCISCPTCRVEYPLPEGGAADLPNAFQINSLLELRKELVNRKSLAEELTNSTVNSTSAMTSMTCSIHNDPLKIYCETCRKLICRDCIVTKKHKSHDFELVSECYSKHYRKIEAELKLVQQKLAATDTAMAGLTAREMEVTDQGEEIKKKIHTHAQQLIDQMVRSEKQLMQDVDTTVQHKRQLLRKQREEAEKIHSQLKTCKEMIEKNQRMLSQEAFLLKKQMMIDQMDKAGRNIDLAVFQPLEMANIEFTKNQLINGEIGMVMSGLSAFAYFPPPTATATASNRPTIGGGTVDPFGGSDPFGTDPFLSVNTPKATATQTPFGRSSPFWSSDPFSFQGLSGDPFASNDPFSASSGVVGGTGGSDPFGGNPFGPSSGFSSDHLHQSNTSKPK